MIIQNTDFITTSDIKKKNHCIISDDELAIKIAFRLASSVDSLHVIIYLSLRYAISRN
jgi:hypothetical protein